jgi:hypothetical protein
MTIIKPVSTRVGRPWQHAEIINGMNDLLLSVGVTLWPMRRKLITHHIIACGWRQACWNHNYWAVQKGKSWPGDTYIMPTKEDNGDGTMRDVSDQQWRAFTSPEHALSDYLDRINPDNSWSAAYRKGGELLRDPDATDKEFWLAIAPKYATDTKNFANGNGFASISRRVENTLAPEKKKLN